MSILRLKTFAYFVLKILPLSVVAITTIFGWPAQAQESSRPAGAQMSPGPRGGILELDLRVPATTLDKPSSQGPGDYVRWIKSSDMDRFYEVHVPPQYHPSKPMPAVITIHGGGGFPGTVRYESKMNEVADKHGFIVIYPAGTGSAGYDRKLYWNTGPLRKDAALRKVDDVAYMAAVLDDIGSFFPIDKSRIYATGISNGGQMSFRLASELSNRIAAVGPVSGDRTIGQFFKAPPRPMPIIAFHGMKDTYLAFNGGDTPATSGFANVNRLPVAESMQGWVRQAGANPNAVQTSRKGQAILHHYPPAGNKGVEVDFWVLEDGGHTWPGGRATKIEERLGVGPINQDIFASEVMWEFFQRHHL